jgi:two-component system response regulator RegA
MTKTTETAGENVLLVVDDDHIYRERLCLALSGRGWDVKGASDGVTGLRLAVAFSPDLIVVDLKLPEEDGLDIVRELRVMDDTSCIIVLTGYGSIATALLATRLGADHYLSKPVDADQILAAYQKTVTGTDGPGLAASGTVPSLARVEWEYIQRVLTDCDGNISRAAKLLGLHRRSLQRKLSKYPPNV